MTKLIATILLTSLLQINISYAATALTAQDQSNSTRDVELTRKIRESIVDQDSFSSNAKNIKIITINGNVTLKGPVNSINERNQIESIAQKMAGSARVSNQMEVKSY